MHYSASTQRLLDELAARERRVLQQLCELSGMNQSPIAPSRSYASLPVTPERLNTVSPHPAPSAPLSLLPSSPSAVIEREDYHEEKPSCRERGKNHLDAHFTSRGATENLERDLQRLQYLLRHSPLIGVPPVLMGAGHENGSEATGAQKPLHRLMADGEGGAAAVHEKRTRGARGPNLSASPVTPEVKRDRREAHAYFAPPPPLASLPSHSGMSPRPPSGGSASPTQRSSVLDMGEELGDADMTPASDALTPFAEAAAGAVCGGAEEKRRRTSAAMPTERPSAKTLGAVQVRPYRDSDDTVSSEEYDRQPAVPAAASSTGAWQRSPVRWFSSAAAAASASNSAPPHDGREKAEEVEMLCASALDTWAAHRSAHQQARGVTHFNSASMATSLPLKERLSRALHPSRSPSHSEVQHNLHAPPHPALPSTSPPPRVPGPSSFPLGRNCQAGASTAEPTSPMPALGEDGAAPPFAATSPRHTVTPQPRVHSRGGQHGNRASVEAQAPRAAATSPLGAMQTASWYALKAFYARQSDTGALLTPLREMDLA
ncbi:hypothetical protein LSCM1_04393 [Leishmania martiniquensis]|uniref:Uncharacterized protein n=1 Tax=Leishmania martiniquensis TaxID=1580590 RepID=A0A836H210_9TRYP|nr:hypothetical protein LSCM1_04393 [Leishmania martiniquensis]